MTNTHAACLLATADVARALGLTPNAIRTARKRGDLKPAATTPGGVSLYSREEVGRFAARRDARRKLLEEAAGA